ncbi:MAG: four helix bundle protein [Dehalogenimonas sp.]|uniref:Four helix bundle protein n=1 Tax=Candidatus Dehalogenimonas loeffleri TaxID=3127115 RepID=A0ABZ2J9Q7_9CHLR|nr:four helix bundle protein [Dehalogenimonas sp.]
MQNYKNLSVWQKAHRLAVDVYLLTEGFPSNEIYGLTSQMRRCSVSIPANIAEGCGRNGKAELSRFLHISTGSACELEYYLLLAGELHYISESQSNLFNEKVTEIKRMISSLTTTVKASNALSNNAN